MFLLRVVIPDTSVHTYIVSANAGVDEDNVTREDDFELQSGLGADSLKQQGQTKRILIFANIIF
jgi:hypothetical protein